ncbi:hypothetical protein [Paraburkholderia sp. BCC1884]|uniref:hypothetical protein n=1 Tax=Paraburkholderia sp. BCC1884 TaxID=2562668 RepID=UPI0011836A7E|nr:hypothetical protein [Paraburkholderia sp. BCC1884]
MNNSTDLLTGVSEILTESTKAMSVFSARAMVLGSFFDAAIPYLAPLQRIEVTQSFRRRIEDVMSMMDDVSLPAEYHSTLLDLTNSVLATLENKRQGITSATQGRSPAK